jgi:hypothetical protein
MTSTQLGIVVGLGVVVCVLFAIMGWLVLGGGPSSLFQQAPTSAPQMTFTPFVLPTLTPTLTLTPLPYEELIPAGWTQHKTALIEIWLPEGFKPVKSSKIDAIKPDAALAELILESDSSTALYQNLAMVFYQPLNGSETLETFLDRELPAVSQEYVTTNRKKTTLNAVDMTMITLETRSSNVVANTSLYVFQDGGTVWFVAYSAEISEYFTMLSQFEKSAKTFRIVR